MTNAIKILARNNPPYEKCKECGATGHQICTKCGWEGKNDVLCDKCAEKHEHEEEMFLPLVNSPRAGVCGYTG